MSICKSVYFIHQKFWSGGSIIFKGLYLQYIRYFSRRHYVRFTDDFYFSKMTLSSQLNNILNRENVLKLFSSKKNKEDFEMLHPAKVFKYRQLHKLKNYQRKQWGVKKDKNITFGTNAKSHKMNQTYTPAGFKIQMMYSTIFICR